MSIEESRLASRHSSVTAQRPSVLANGVFKATRFKAPTPDSKNEFWENHLEGGHFSGKDKGFFDGERGITLRVAVCLGRRSLYSMIRL